MFVIIEKETRGKINLKFYISDKRMLPRTNVSKNSLLIFFFVRQLRTSHKNVITKSLINEPKSKSIFL